MALAKFPPFSAIRSAVLFGSRRRLRILHVRALTSHPLSAAASSDRRPASSRAPGPNADLYCVSDCRSPYAQQLCRWASRQARAGSCTQPPARDAGTRTPGPPSRCRARCASVSDTAFTVTRAQHLHGLERCRQPATGPTTLRWSLHCISPRRRAAPGAGSRRGRQGGLPALPKQEFFVWPLAAGSITQAGMPPMMKCSVPSEPGLARPA
jgi:hypothetical protein